MSLPGRLARGLRPLADGSPHILGHAFPRGRSGLFPPRLLLSRHPNGQCFTHVSSVTHAFSVVKAGRFLELTGSKPSSSLPWSERSVPEILHGVRSQSAPTSAWLSAIRRS